MEEIDGDGEVRNSPVFREIKYAIIRNEEIRRKRRRCFGGKINFDLNTINTKRERNIYKVFLQ